MLTVGVVRRATSNSTSGSVMLLLSCPSLKRTMRWRRPWDAGAASAIATLSKIALLP